MCFTDSWNVQSTTFAETNASSGIYLRLCFLAALISVPNKKNFLKLLTFAIITQTLLSSEI